MTLKCGVVKFFSVITLDFFFADAKCTLNCILYCNETQKKNGRGEKEKALNPNAQFILCFWCFLLITSDNNNKKKKTPTHDHSTIEKKKKAAPSPFRFHNNKPPTKKSPFTAS